VLPALLVAAGLVLLGAGLALVRGMGRGYRIGRTLAVAPFVPVTAAVEMAHAGQTRYVRVHGRVTSDEEFPDEHDRPLVYRRRRLELAAGDGWRVVFDDRESVPFGIEERAAYIAVDAARLDEGLVVLPRESNGRAGDVAEHLPAGTDPATPTRFRVDQVSAVEQVDVAGQPVVGPGGTVMMTAGAGRPLILSTLERGEAMRVLGAGHIRRLRLAAACLAAGMVSLALAVLAASVALGFAVLGPPDMARAATPAGTSGPAAASSAQATIGPSGDPSVVPSPGDTRSSGAGPGLVGQPFLAILIVLVVGGLGLAAAVGYGRLRGHHEDGA
jgi:hypothetical protein